MINISVVCIGKCKEKYLVDACKEYAKRLQGFCKFELCELDEVRASDNPSPREIEKVLEGEGKRILEKIPAKATVVALCIEGKQWSSPELSAFLQEQPVMGVSHIVFVIGGSFGLWDEVKNRANVKLSFSKMTFPHQLFRVLLLEQIYRGFQIALGSKYHK